MSSKKIVVVLPTYNEKDNIVFVLDAILKQQKAISQGKLFVLVVDDSSPDGTAKLVKNYSLTHKNVSLLTGRKNGLGAAYMRGFAHATGVLKADIVFEMDADFSHDPKLIPLFVKKILSGFDVVIGSRYIPGGTIPANWSLFRKANSKFGNIFARYLGGMQGVKDCTSGYRAIAVSALKKVQMHTLRTKGYSFQISLLYALLQEDAVVHEIPIVFVDRVRGESKIRFADITEFVLFTIALRLEKTKARMRKLFALNSKLSYEKTYSK